MDFIVELPLSGGCTNILVITDRLSKGVILKSCLTIIVKNIANVFIRQVLRRHGLPKAIVSDRGTQFTSLFWKTLCQRFGMTQRLSTAYHPETDGSTERMNQTLEEYLRSYVSFYQDDWSSWLPIAEYAINNRDATATGVSPFFFEHGYHGTVGPELPETPRTTGPILNADTQARCIQEIIEHA